MNRALDATPGKEDAGGDESAHTRPEMDPARPKSDHQETIFEGSPDQQENTIAESPAETPTKGTPAGENVTPEAFAGLVSQSGLLSADELDSIQKELTLGDEPADAEALAKLLITRNKLTEYQARQLHMGKVKGLVFGNYIVLDELGKGGMGMVYKAYHRRMKRTVALKVLPPEMTSEANALARFHREVEAAGKLTHPNIAAAYDADEANGIHFMIMEFVDGPDLSAYVAEHGALNLAQSLQLTLQTAIGLEHAHKEGVVHRDIKPSNLLVDPTGTLKILDMGLAQLQRDTPEAEEEDKSDLTQSGRVLGTVDYMAPEQAMDAKRADYRADIYSLGCTLYFMLTGKAPAPEGTLTKKLLWHQNEQPSKLVDACPDVSPTLEAAFQKMLAKKPEDRQQSMAEVIDELQVCIKELPPEELEAATLGLSVSADKAIAARRPGSTAAAMPYDATIAEPNAVAPLLPESHGWSKRKVIAIAASVLLLLGATYGVVQQLGASDRPDPPAVASDDKPPTTTDSTTPTNPGSSTPTTSVLPAPKTQLLVRVDQPGAMVSVDGKQLGRSPVDLARPLALEVTPGKHELKVTKDGFEDIDTQFTAEARTPLELTIKLAALPAIETSPAHKLLRWVFDSQGTATLLDDNGKTLVGVRALDELPEDEFTVVGVNLDKTDVTNNELAALAGVQTLETLSLADTPITDTGLANLENLDRLVRLNLAQTKVGDAGTSTIGSLTKLRELNLKGTRVTDRGLPAVGKLTNLETLHLADTAVTGAGLSSLSNLSRLLIVSLNGADVSAQSVRKLKLALPKVDVAWDVPTLDRDIARKLVSKGAVLTLRTDDDKLVEGVDRLADVPEQVFYLAAVSLNGNKKVTDADLEPLSGLEHLESLDLAQTPITSRGLAPLEKIASLKRIDLGALQLDKVAVEKLRAALPGRSVHWAPISDRSLAEWILSKGGYVTLETTDGEAIRDVKDAKSLPAARFDIRSVHLEDIKGLTDGDLGRLVDLRRPAELYLDKSPIGDKTLQTIAAMPTLRTLSLNETKITDAGLPSVAKLTGLKRLFISDTAVTDTGLQNIRSMRGLTHLSLAGTKVSSSGLSHVARFADLSWLNAADTAINDDAVNFLASLTSLKTLMIDRTKLSDAGVEQLKAKVAGAAISADPPNAQRLAARWVLTNGGSVVLSTGEITRIEQLPRDACTVLGIDLADQKKVAGKDLIAIAACGSLESINLRGTSVDDASMSHLAGLTSLKRITLDETRVSDVGVQQFKALTKLESLLLASTRVRGSAFTDLAALTNLTHLKLSQTFFADSAMAALKPFAKLESLDLSYNRQITDRGVAQIASLKEIRWLALRGTQVTDAVLPQIGRYTNLVNLDLSSTKITDAIASQLPRLTRLTTLELNSTDTGDSTLRAAENLTGLKSLSMTRTNVTKEAAEQVRTARPSLRFSSSSRSRPQDREQDRGGFRQ